MPEQYANNKHQWVMQMCEICVMGLLLDDLLLYRDNAGQLHVMSCCS